MGGETFYETGSESSGHFGAAPDATNFMAFQSFETPIDGKIVCLDRVKEKIGNELNTNQQSVNLTFLAPC